MLPFKNAHPKPVLLLVTFTGLLVQVVVPDCDLRFVNSFYKG